MADGATQGDGPAIVDPESGRPWALLSDLGEYFSAQTLDSLPDEVREQSKLSILDTIGCMVAGADDPDTLELIETERQTWSQGTSRVVGHKLRLPDESAARVNGYSGDVFEHNDLIGSHASIATLPSAMAAAEVTNASGADLLLAYVVGTEIVARLYDAYYAQKKAYADVAIAPPGIINGIGSGAGCAVIRKLGRVGMTESMAIGGALAGWCPVGAVYDAGGTTKPLLHGAWPASIGVLAARYAEAGMTGPVRLLESEIGLFSTLADGYKAKAVQDPGFWHLANPRRKLHAACGYTHAGADALYNLRRELGEKLLEAEAITIRVPFYTFRAVSKNGPPVSRTDARFHLQFAAALTGAGEDYVRPVHGSTYEDYLAREDIGRLISRIGVEVDERFTHYQQCAVDIRWPDGSVTHHEGTPARGSPANPMTREMAADKFRDNVSGRLTDAETDAYIDTVLGMETLKDCSALYAPFEPAA